MDFLHFFVIEADDTTSDAGGGESVIGEVKLFFDSGNVTTENTMSVTESGAGDAGNATKGQERITETKDIAIKIDGITKAMP